MSVKIDLTILLFILLFCFTSQIEIYLILMLFAFLHEIGHLCMGLCLGFRPKEIKINPMGIKMEFKPKYEDGHSIVIKRAMIAMAGPITNFIIICMIAYTKLINYPISITIIYANFLIGIFNLIPIYPLDGGRILKEILYITVGLKKSNKYIYIISKVTIISLTIISSIAILFVKNISIIIIIAYLWLLVSRLRESGNLYKND